ncbi:hypothetical protein PTKU64_93960 (plasmid) [Paraburkholderia terrae]|uniref:Uncharacterized protein n=1 Tax=Paraburkholderia terrae TaxID=311230 RepID=A0ABN6JXN1_9BURK|nr:hypothetical protein [Paraburkholderia terrae]BCZ85721.1 hypothetical protein PTKU64_93960 [Paraburkholderia terrae]
MKRSSRSSCPRHVRVSDRLAQESETQTATPANAEDIETAEASKASAQPEAPTVSGVVNNLYARLAVHFGKRGAKRLRMVWILAIFMTLAIGTIAPYRNEILARPMVADNVERVFGDPLPTAQRGVFTIILADLDDDDDRSTQQFLLAWLPQQLPVKIVRLGRHLHVPKAEDHAAVESTLQSAQEYLKKTGAQLLIWGRLHHVGTQPAGLEVHYTLPPNAPRWELRSRLYGLTDRGLIAMEFRQDLASVVKQELDDEIREQQDYERTILPQLEMARL